MIICASTQVMHWEGFEFLNTTVFADMIKCLACEQWLVKIFRCVCISRIGHSVTQSGALSLNSDTLDTLEILVILDTLKFVSLKILNSCMHFYASISTSYLLNNRDGFVLNNVSTRGN